MANRALRGGVVRLPDDALGVAKHRGGGVWRRPETSGIVPLYLLGRKNFLAHGLPELIGLGDESEALSYFVSALSEWLKTPGAVEWVRENAEEKTLWQFEQE